MSKKPYSNGWLPMSRAAAALQNQADTIFDELNASIDRNAAFKAKMRERAEEKRRSAEAAKALHQINDDFCAKMQAIDLHYAKLEKAVRGAEAQKAVDDAAFASAMLFSGMTPGPTSLRVAGGAPVTDSRLHSLRRLFHHVTHGGKTNEADWQTVGAPPTLPNISRRIEQLEELQRVRHEAAAKMRERAEAGRAPEFWENEP